MKTALNDLLVLFGITFIVCVTWQMLELGIEGKIIASHVDSIITIILTYSLYGNYCSYIRNK